MNAGDITYWVYIVRSDEGIPLYVGMTGSITSRLKNHRCKSDWWKNSNRVELIACDDRADAANTERRTITEIRPLHNIDWNAAPIHRHRAMGERVEQVLNLIGMVSAPITTAEIREITGYQNSAVVCHRLHRSGVIKAVGWTRKGCPNGWVASWVLASSPLPSVPMPEKAEVA